VKAKKTSDKAVKTLKDKMEKTTLGDITGLAEIKKQMEEAEKNKK